MKLVSVLCLVVIHEAKARPANPLRLAAFFRFDDPDCFLCFSVREYDHFPYKLLFMSVLILKIALEHDGPALSVYR